MLKIDLFFINIKMDVNDIYHMNYIMNFKKCPYVDIYTILTIVPEDNLNTIYFIDYTQDKVTADNKPIIYYSYLMQSMTTISNSYFHNKLIYCLKNGINNYLDVYFRIEFLYNYNIPIHIIIHEYHNGITLKHTHLFNKISFEEIPKKLQNIITHKLQNK